MSHSTSCQTCCGCGGSSCRVCQPVTVQCPAPQAIDAPRNEDMMAIFNDLIKRNDDARKALEDRLDVQIREMREQLTAAKAAAEAARASSTDEADGATKKSESAGGDGGAEGDEAESAPSTAAANRNGLPVVMSTIMVVFFMVAGFIYHVHTQTPGGIPEILQLCAFVSGLGALIATALGLSSLKKHPK